MGGVFAGAHVVFEAAALDDLSVRDVAAKLVASGGAHAASAFEL